VLLVAITAFYTYQFGSTGLSGWRFVRQNGLEFWFLILPAIILSIFGVFGVAQLKKTKILLIVWGILFLLWIFYLLSLTAPMPGPV